MTHSPEPWSICEDRILDANDRGVTAWNPITFLDDEDMRRAVACVNFCRHIETDWMDGKVVPKLPADAESLASLSGLIGLIPVCKEKP